MFHAVVAHGINYLGGGHILSEILDSGLDIQNWKTKAQAS